METLAAQLERIYNQVAGSLPKDLASTMKEEMEALALNQIVPGLKVGEKAPDFTLPDTRGGFVSFSETLAKGPVVISFYRGSWCPFCTFELRAQIQALPEIEAFGATLMAISPENQENSSRLVQMNNIPFPVLTDITGTVVQAYRVAWNISEELRSLFLKYFRMDLAKINEQAGWMLPVPATYVIDQDGIIRLSYAEVDYSKRLEPDKIVEALRSI